MSFIIYSCLIFGSFNLIISLINNILIRNRLMIINSSLFLLCTLNLDYNFSQIIFKEVNIIKLSDFSIDFHIEPMGVIFLNLLAILWIPTLLYTHDYLFLNKINNQSRFLFFFNLCILIGIIISFAANLFTMLVFYELLTLATIPLILHQGSDEVEKGLNKYLKILFSTSIFLFLPAVIFIYLKVGHGNFVNHGIILGNLTSTESILILLLCIFGISKTAIFPLGGWLPAAMVATYPVSALLHSVVVVKIGLFCLFKILVYIFGLSYLHELFSTYFNWLIFIPLITILHSSLSGIRTDKIKELLAYSTISQLSISIISAFLFSPEGIRGAMIHMCAHAFSKISLFFAAGSIYSLQKTEYVKDLVGIYKIMPTISIIIIISILSLIGIPPLAGFISKYSIMHAAHNKEAIFITFIIIGSGILTAIYLSKILSIFYSHASVENYKEENIEKTLPITMRLAIIFCSIWIILFFLMQKFIDHFLNYIL